MTKFNLTTEWVIKVSENDFRKIQQKLTPLFKNSDIYYDDIAKELGISGEYNGKIPAYGYRAKDGLLEVTDESNSINYNFWNLLLKELTSEKYSILFDSYATIGDYYVYSMTNDPEKKGCYCIEANSDYYFDMNENEAFVVKPEKLREMLEKDLCHNPYKTLDELIIDFCNEHQKELGMFQPWAYIEFPC